MANDPLYRIWITRLLFTISVFILILLPMAPIDLAPLTWPRPDLVYCVFFAVVLRRPDMAPYWLVGFIFLMVDLLRMQPIGLWAGVALVGLEVARNSRRSIQENLFIGEWIWLAFSYTLCCFLVFLIEKVFFVPTKGIQDVLLTIGFTTLAYPLVLLVITQVFRIRHPKSTDFEGGIQSL
jgi:rod shape-determining protein MreD